MAKTKEQIEPAADLGQLDRIAKITAKLEKDFGKGIIMGAKEKPKYHDYLTTGSIGLDKALGIGGLPKGRITEIYGPESSGKTTLAIHVIAQALKNKTSQCAFVDVEHAFSTLYAEQLGVDLDRLYISQPDYGEQALEITRQLVDSGEFDVIVLDSVAALVPKSELEGEVGDASMGKQARMMSQVMRMLVASVSKTNTILIFINQLRDKIGVMFGSPETTTGGNALKFYSSVRLDVRRSLTAANAVMDGEKKVGNQTTVKVVKNKMAPPFMKCEFDIIYSHGIDMEGEVLDLAVELGVVEKAGTWFSYKDGKLGQGREATRVALQHNPELFEEIREKTAKLFTPKEYVPTQKEVEDAA